MSSSSRLFGWLPGRRAAAQRQARARRAVLAEFEFALAGLSHELEQLAELSQTSRQDDAVVAAAETTATSRILEVIVRGEHLASDTSDEELVSAWRGLATNIDKACRLGQGPHKAAKLTVAVAKCERLQQLVDKELSGLEGSP